MIANAIEEDPDYYRKATSLPGWPPRLEGRDDNAHVIGSLLVRGGTKQSKPAKVDDDESWHKISERLSVLLESDEALDALAERLDNPAAL